ncbi:MAG TPA: hypothetical protein VF817_02725 [Patescibacteria group bacterium]
MKKILRKQKVAIALGVYVILIVCLVYFVIVPILGKINDAREQIQKESMDQESRSQQLSQLPKMKLQYQNVQDGESSIDVLLSNNDAVDLIERLEKLADQTGNKITITAQDPAAQKTAPAQSNNQKNKAPDQNSIAGTLPSPDYLQMQLQLSGDYNAILKFITALENLEYYSDVTSVEIKQDQTETNANIASSVGTGALNPFASSTNNKIQNADIASIKNARKNNRLAASLNVVFYINK